MKNTVAGDICVQRQREFSLFESSYSVVPLLSVLGLLTFLAVGKATCILISSMCS